MCIFWGVMVVVVREIERESVCVWVEKKEIYTTLIKLTIIIILCARYLNLMVVVVLLFCRLFFTVMCKLPPVVA